MMIDVTNAFSLPAAVPEAELDGRPSSAFIDTGLTSRPTVHPTLTHCFFLDEKDQTTVRWWVGAVGPVSFG